MRVNVGDPELVAELLEYFESQADCVAVQLGSCEIEVTLLGSYRTDRHDAAVDDLVDRFRATHPLPAD